MKRELGKKIRSICDELGVPAAGAACEEIITDLEKEYDKRVSVGMSELDAYRDVLKNIDKIKKTLEELPKTEEQIEKQDAKLGQKNLKSILGKVSTVTWLSIVILYFVISMIGGAWHLTWLIFLWGAMCQTVLDMVMKYNKGTPLRKVLRSGLSTILWLAIVTVYILFSFATGLWHISWLIFIAGALVQTILGWVLPK